VSTQHDARPLLNPALLQETIETALQSGATFAEVFVEDKRSTSAVLDDSKIEELTSGRRRGAGIRVILGETTGFAHTADLSPEGLQTAARAAAAARPLPPRPLALTPRARPCSNAEKSDEAMSFPRRP